MKNLKFFLVNILYPSGCIFTILSLTILTIGSFSTEKAAMTLPTLYLFLMISVFVALSNNIFKITKINLFFRALIHMIASIFSVIISLGIANVLGADYDLSIKKISLVFVFILIYSIIVFPTLIIYTAIVSKKKATGEYKSVFTKK